MSRQSPRGPRSARGALIAALRNRNGNFVPKMADWQLLLGREFPKFKAEVAGLIRATKAEPEDVERVLKFELFDRIVEYAEAKNVEAEAEDESAFFEAMRDLAQNMVDDFDFGALRAGFAEKLDQAEDMATKRVRDVGAGVKSCTFEQAALLSVIYDKYLNKLRAKAAEYGKSEQTLIKKLMNFIKDNCPRVGRLTVAAVNGLAADFLAEADFHLGGVEYRQAGVQKRQSK